MDGGLGSLGRLGLAAQGLATWWMASRGYLAAQDYLADRALADSVWSVGPYRMGLAERVSPCGFGSSDLAERVSLYGPRHVTR